MANRRFVHLGGPRRRTHECLRKRPPNKPDSRSDSQCRPSLYVASGHRAAHGWRIWIGLSVVQPIGENEPVTESRLTSRTSGAGAGLGVPAGMRAISVHVVDSSGVVSLLRPGHK